MTNSGDFLYMFGVIKFKFSDSLASLLKLISLAINFKDHHFLQHSHDFFTGIDSIFNSLLLSFWEKAKLIRLVWVVSSMTFLKLSSTPTLSFADVCM